MNFKKIIAILLLIILPIIIYITNVDKKIYYLSLGDSLALGQNPYGNIGYGFSDYVSDYLREKGILEFYTKKYSVSGYRTTDLIRDIEKNKKIEVDNKEITIKNALTNADIVTLSIGLNDLLYKLSLSDLSIILGDKQKLNQYINDVLLDIEKLIILMRKYCKEDIILIGYYNPLWIKNINYANETEFIFLDINKRMKDLAKKYDLYYVDIYQMFKENKDFFSNPTDIHPSSRGYKAISDKIITIIEQNVIN